MGRQKRVIDPLDVRYERLKLLYQRIENEVKEYYRKYRTAMPLSEATRRYAERFRELDERIWAHWDAIKGVRVCGRAIRGQRRYLWPQSYWRRLLPEERYWIGLNGSLIGYTGPQRQLKGKSINDFMGVDEGME